MNAEQIAALKAWPDPRVGDLPDQCMLQFRPLFRLKYVSSAGEITAAGRAARDAA